MTTQSPTQRAHTEPTETGCAASEPTPSWREYMALNPDWQTARTPNVYAAGYYAGMRHPRLPVATASGVVPTVAETGAFLVTSPSIEEALTALDNVHEGISRMPGDRDRFIHTVRVALTSAAAAFEADAAEIAELRGQLEGANGYAKSYLDASYASRDRIAELESNLSDMTKLRDEADGQFCGALDRIGAMHAELASAQRVASALEWLASREDTKERLARADGAFNLAVCHQQYAAWWRSGTPTQAIRGTECKTLVAHVSDGLVITEGDAMPDPDALYSIAVAIYPAAQRVAALSEAERNALERSIEARQAERRLREHHPDNSTEHWRRRDMVSVAEALRTKAVDALLALRAAGGKADG